MDLNSVFPRALKAEDFQSGPQSYTIASVEVKEFESDKGGKDHKPCFYFEETAHWLVANKTNTETICKNLGTSKSEEMVGRRVTLKKDRTQFGSKTVDCIRVTEEAF